MDEQKNNHSLKAEQALLGALLVDAKCLEVVLPVVRPKDFQLELNKEMYRTICEMENRGDVIDPVTVVDQMKPKGLASEDSLVSYVMQLMDLTPTAAHAEDYAKIVRKNGELRRLKAMGEWITQTVDEGNRTTTEISSTVEQGLDEIDGGAGELLSISDAMLRFFDYRTAVEAGTINAVISTGFPRLDKMLGGGFLAQGFYILAARPSIGKTAVGLAIAAKVAERGLPVLYISLEMPDTQLVARLLAAKLGLSTSKLMTEKLSEEQNEKLVAEMSKQAGSPITFNGRTSANMDDIASMVRACRGRKLVILDYIGLIDKRSDRMSIYEHITETSRALKNMANKFKFPILALAQLNRESVKREDKTPQISDLRDSGALEQDADGVLLLHRPDFYRDDPPDSWEIQEMQVFVQKNRHGGTGCVSFSYQPMTGLLEDEPPQEKPEKKDPVKPLPEETEVPFC